MIALLEKLVWIFAGLSVTVVVVFVITGPLKSEITKETMMEQYYIANPHKRPGSKVAAPGPIQRQSFGPATTQAPRPATPAPAPGQPAAPQPNPYTNPASPYSPGVVVAAPVFLPEAMVQKYQHWEDVYDLSMTAYGEDYTMPDGSVVFELKEINEDSPLGTMLDFKPRDRIISINGYAANKANGRQLYETLKNENTWSVLIERNGQQQSLTFRR